MRTSEVQAPYCRFGGQRRESDLKNHVCAFSWLLLEVFGSEYSGMKRIANWLMSFSIISTHEVTSTSVVKRADA